MAQDRSHSVGRGWFGTPSQTVCHVLSAEVAPRDYEDHSHGVLASTGPGDDARLAATEEGWEGETEGVGQAPPRTH